MLQINYVFRNKIFEEENIVVLRVLPKTAILSFNKILKNHWPAKFKTRKFQNLINCENNFCKIFEIWWTVKINLLHNLWQSLIREIKFPQKINHFVSQNFLPLRYFISENIDNLHFLQFQPILKPIQIFETSSGIKLLNFFNYGFSNYYWSYCFLNWIIFIFILHLLCFYYYFVPNSFTSLNKKMKKIILYCMEILWCEKLSVSQPGFKTAKWKGCKSKWKFRVFSLPKLNCHAIKLSL